MIRFLVSPFLAFALMMLYAGLMGRDRLVEYAIGQEKVLIEEYLIILALVTIYNVARITHDKYIRKNNPTE